jgi:uncharacterized protein
MKQLMNKVKRIMKQLMYLMSFFLLAGVAPSFAGYEAEVKPFYQAKDYSGAFAVAKRAAKAGHAAAQLDLGAMYAKGYGTSVNTAAAATWFKAAAAQGHPGAQYNLALLYDRGQGVERDPDAALSLYRKAAEQGLVPAQHSLGVVLYAEGERDPELYQEAGVWFRRAAEAGHPGAQFNLGVLYEDGYGAQQDYMLAYTWFTLAAGLGLKEAEAARSELADRLTPGQLARATDMAKACRASKFKDCQ